MTHAQIIEKKRQTMEEATALSKAEQQTVETRQRVTNLLAQADELTEQAKNAERIEAHAEEMRSFSRPPRADIQITNNDDLENEPSRTT